MTCTGKGERKEGGGHVLLAEEEAETNKTREDRLVDYAVHVYVYIEKTD